MRLLLHVAVVYSVVLGLPTQLFKVDDLRTVINDHHHPMFEPLIIGNYGKEEKLNIHIADKLGKFFKLDYHSTVHDDVEVLHLEDMSVEYIECVFSFNETFKLSFDKEVVAAEYYDMINQADTINYFIHISPEWKCYHESTYSSIQHVLGATLVDKELVLTTKNASITDIFKTLRLETSSNYLNSLTANAEHGFRRRRRLVKEQTDCEKLGDDDDDYEDDEGECEPGVFSDTNHDVEPAHPSKHFWSKIKIFFGDLFNKIGHELKAGLHDFVKAVRSGFNALLGAISFMEKAFTGEKWDCRKEGSASWDFNYYRNNDKDYGACEDTLSFPDTNDATCIDCYASAEFSYYIYIQLQDLKITEFIAKAGANIDAHMAVLATAEAHGYSEVSTAKKKTGLYIRISNGIKLAITMSGTIGVGFTFKEGIVFGFQVDGELKRGIKYTNYGKEHRNNDYHPINTLNWKRKGPVFTDWVSSATAIAPKTAHIYSRFTVRLNIDQIGDVYVSMEPQIALTWRTRFGLFLKDEWKKCKATSDVEALVSFAIGAELKPFNAKKPLWSIELPLGGLKSGPKNIDLGINSDGHRRFTCHKASDINELASTYRDEENSRRLATSDGFKSLVKNVDMDFTAVGSSWHPDFRWGHEYTQWHSKLILLRETCPQNVSFGNNATDTFELILPDAGWTLIYTDSNDGTKLSVSYVATVNLTSLSNEFPIDDNETTITCSNTYTMDRIEHEFVNGDGADRYKVTKDNGSVTHEWCSIADWSWITYEDHPDLYTAFQMPPEMDAIFLDGSYGSILLIDDSDIHCHSFLLSQTPLLYDDESYSDFAQIFDWTQLVHNQWDGALYCAHLNFTESLIMMFEEYDESTGDILAVLVDSGYYGLVNGSINLSTFALDLSVEVWYDITTWTVVGSSVFNFDMIGVVNVLNDGWMVYTGLIYWKGEAIDCTGFVFQIHVNLPIEKETSEIDAGNDEDESAVCFNQQDQYIIIGATVIVFLCLLCICMVQCVYLHKKNKAAPVQQNTNFQL